MKKNDTFIAECMGYTEDGAGVVRNDNMVFFVPGLIVGETAEIAVTKLKKSYGYARVLDVLEPSKHRVKPKCSVHKLCGGCTLQYMDYEEQKRLKEDKVKNCFERNAHMRADVLPILTARQIWNYRNKVQIPIQYHNRNVEMGFYQNHTNRIISYEECCVQSELSNQIGFYFKQLLEQYGGAKEMRHLLIKHAHRTNEAMVVLITRHYPFHGAQKIVQRLTQKFPEIVSLSAIVNQRTDNVILDGKEVLIYGKPYIEETLLGKTFRISARSFYQINPYSTEILYSKAIELAKLSGRETVIDLYCGTGTIGILAAEYAKKVYGIEVIADAVKDAKTNAQINHVTNIDFYCMDASKGAQAVLRSKIKVDVVIVDPPRKGCSKETIEAIIKINPKRLVYVSCDPATLARDVTILKESGYVPKTIQPVDMFPMTPHVETVVLLTRQ